MKDYEKADIYKKKFRAAKRLTLTFLLKQFDLASEVSALGLLTHARLTSNLLSRLKEAFSYPGRLLISRPTSNIEAN